MKSDAAFLKRYAARKAVEYVYSPEHMRACGQCTYQQIMRDTARKLLRRKLPTLKQWSDETEKAWQRTKFVKLWNEAKAAGNDPKKVFKARGWTP